MMINSHDFDSIIKLVRQGVGKIDALNAVMGYSSYFYKIASESQRKEFDEAAQNAKGSKKLDQLEGIHRLLKSGTGKKEAIKVVTGYKLLSTFYKKLTQKEKDDLKKHRLIWSSKVNNNTFMVDLLNIKSYMAYWCGVRKSTPNDEQAYELVETEMMRVYGVGMYENFDAFRQARGRYKGKVWAAIHSGDVPQETIQDMLTIPGYVSMVQNVKYHHEKGRVLTDDEAYTIVEEFIRETYDISYCNTLEAYKELKRNYVRAQMKREQKAQVYKGKKG